MSPKAIILSGLLSLSIALPSKGQGESALQHFLSFFDGKKPVSLEIVLHRAGQRLDQAREIGDAIEEAKALKDLGLIHLAHTYDYETAMDYFIRGLAIEDSMHLEAQKALTYVAIARVFEVVGDYFKSAQFLDQALSLNEAHGDINTLAMILNNLGKVKASMGKTDEAFGFYEQVLRYKGDTDRRFEAEALFNMGHLYTLRGQYPEALANHKKALQISRALGDRYREALSLNDIGILYGRMQEDDKSLANHKVALEIRESLADKPGMAESYNNLGWLHYKLDHPEKAITNGLLALELGRESQVREQIFKSYELLSQSYKELLDFRSALTYKELSLAMYEFIQNEKHERQLLETQNRYQLGKKEIEIQKLDALRRDRENQIAAQNKFEHVLFVAVGLSCVIAGLLLVLYLVKQRSNRILESAKNEVQLQNSKLQDLNHTKDKFFSIISHDLKGPLNSLTSFSRLLIDHTDNLSKEEIRMVALDLDKSLKNLFALLENLLEWSRSQTGNIDFTPEVFDLGELLKANKSLLEAQAKNKDISILLDAVESCPVKLHRQSVNTVVRNLLSNAIKFTPQGGTVRLSLTRQAQGVSISVTDNGVGMSEEVRDRLFRIDHKHSSQGTANEKGTGLGLILCREFVEKNGGNIRVKSVPGSGSTFTCSFPQRVYVNAGTKARAPASF